MGFENIELRKRKVALINTNGDIIQSDTVSALDKTSYTFHIQLNSNKIIALKLNNKNGNLLDVTGSLQGTINLDLQRYAVPPKLV